MRRRRAQALGHGTRMLLGPALIALALLAPRAGAAGTIAEDRVREDRTAEEGQGESLGPWRDQLASASGAYQPPPATPATKPLLRRQRPNTISIGIQGSYGVVRGNSRLADGFSHGPGYAFRFRYMVAPSFALGFSFESQRYYNRGGAPSPTPGATDSVVVMTAVSAEGVVYLHREREVNPYFLGGFGHASPDIVDEVLGSTRVNEGLYLVLGAGLERFVRPRFSLDFTLRGYALLSNSEFTSFGQVCAGIHLYPGD
jgi:hypothetical protein